MAAAAAFAGPRPIGRRDLHPETDDVISQFQAVLKRVHAFEQSARDLKTVPVNRRDLARALDKIEKRTEEARHRFQLLNESVASGTVHKDNALFSKASHASAIRDTDDELTSESHRLDQDISRLMTKIVHLKETTSSSIVFDDARLAERKLRLVENDIVHARQRISEAERQFRQVKCDFEQCVKGNRIQVMVMKSMESDMGKIRGDINDLLDRLLQARGDIHRARADLNAQRAIADKQVVKFRRDWDCLKTFEIENPAIQCRFEIFNEIRRLHEDSTRSQRAVSKKLDALQVQVQFEIETNKARIRQLQAELDRMLDVLARIAQDIGLKGLDEVGEHFAKARERQFALVAEIESLCQLRFSLERDLRADAGSDEGAGSSPGAVNPQAKPAPDHSAELLARISQHERTIGDLQRHHDAMAEQLEQIVAFLHNNHVPGAGQSLEIGLAALHSQICDLIEAAGASPPIPSPSGRQSGPEFNILSTSQIPNEDVEHSEQIHDASEASRQFIDALYSQFRRQSVAVNGTEHVLEALFAARRASVASTIQSGTE